MADEDVQKTLEELSLDLQESKARLEEAQRIAHVGHYHWNLIENRVIWSDELCRIYGLNPQIGPTSPRSMVGLRKKRPWLDKVIIHVYTS